MTPEQVSKFEQGPYFQQALRVRYFDDYGKQVGLQIPDLDYYRDRIKRSSLAPN
jgi:predicted HD phosphohydrolase